MTKSYCKQLMTCLLIIVVLLMPINAVAHDMTSGASLQSSACQLMLIEDCSDGSGNIPNQYPANNPDDCCDNEECCSDSAEPPDGSAFTANIFGEKLFPKQSSGYIPEVYLSIFVPPER